MTSESTQVKGFALSLSSLLSLSTLILTSSTINTECNKKKKSHL